jgi:predicted nucleic acid-binding protein
MRVFVDTNVLLDVIAKRVPFYPHSVVIWTLAEQRRIDGLVSVISFTNTFHIVERLKSRGAAQEAVRMIRDTFAPVHCDEQILNQAIDAGFDDFEDAIQYFSALRAKASCLVSRNPHHFVDAEIPVLTPAEFLAAYSFK